MDRIDEPGLTGNDNQNEERDFSKGFAVEEGGAHVINNDGAGGVHMGIAARMIAVFFKPQQLFATMPAKSKWWVPVLLTTIVSLVTTWLALPKLKEMMLAAMPANTSIAAGQLDTIVRIQSISVIAMSAASVIIGVFIMAALYYFLCVVSGGEGKYKQALTIVSYVGLIGALSLIFRTVLLCVIPGAKFDQSFTSLALLLPMDAPKTWLSTILSSVDLFSIWTLIVTAIGLKTMYRMKGKKAWVIVFATWIVFVAVSVAAVAVFASKTM